MAAKETEERMSLRGQAREETGGLEFSGGGFSK